MSERTYTWLEQTHPISGDDISDRDVARRIRALHRNDICFEGILSLARDRIVCLSEEKTNLEEQLLAARNEVQDTHRVTGTLNTNLTTLVKEFYAKHGFYGFTTEQAFRLTSQLCSIVGNNQRAEEDE